MLNLTTSNFTKWKTPSSPQQAGGSPPQHLASSPPQKDHALPLKSSSPPPSDEFETQEKSQIISADGPLLESFKEDYISLTNAALLKTTSLSSPKVPIIANDHRFSLGVLATSEENREHDTYNKVDDSDDWEELPSSPSPSAPRGSNLQQVDYPLDEHTSPDGGFSVATSPTGMTYIIHDENEGSQDPSPAPSFQSSIGKTSPPNAGSVLPSRTPSPPVSSVSPPRIPSPPADPVSTLHTPLPPAGSTPHQDDAQSEPTITESDLESEKDEGVSTAAPLPNHSPVLFPTQMAASTQDSSRRYTTVE